MAVVDLYIDQVHYNSSGELISPGAMLPPSGHGSPLKYRVVTFETVVANDNDSIYRLFKAVDGNEIPVRLEIVSDGVAGLSDVNVGLWDTNLGLVVNENCLADAIDLSSAVTFASPKDGLKDIAIESRGSKRIFELGGHVITSGLSTTRRSAYDIAMKAVAAESAIGTVTATLWTMQG